MDPKDTKILYLMTCPYNLYHDKKSSQQQSGLLNRTYPQDSGHPSDKAREKQQNLRI